MDGDDNTTDAATEAFEDVRRELERLREAVERLVSKPATTPDYTETLSVIHQNVLTTGRRLDTLLQSPALALTPEVIGSAVRQTAVGGGSDGQTYGRTESRPNPAAEAPSWSLERARAPAVPRWWLSIAASAGFLVGLSAFSLITGPFAHAVPAGWLLPERLAVGIMQMSMWDAGERLMAVSDPARRKADVADEQIAVANRDAISACRKRNPGSWKQLHCTVVIQPS